VNGPARSGVSPLLSDAVSLVSALSPLACGAGIVIPDEETGRVRTVGDLQDILDALAPGDGHHSAEEDRT
jgi:hypothetical protein